MKPVLRCRSRSVFLAVALVVLTGCCVTPPYLAVPEAVFRTESMAAERIRLPLDEESGDFLRRFLLAGGDRDNLETGTGADLGAAERYGGLIELLKDPLNLILTEDPALPAVFKTWFPKPPTFQVVDAREAAPPAGQPLAYHTADGRYGWIFYPFHGRAEHLMVVKNVRRTMER